MTLQELKSVLTELEKLEIELPNGKLVPRNFHVTEVGLVTKNFIDCGGQVRDERTVSLQLWSTIDYHHRLRPAKLIDIIELSQDKLGIEGDLPVEVEYQGDTIETYKLGSDGDRLLLVGTKTDCLAQDKCGIPTVSQVKETVIKAVSDCCTPGSGCC